MKIALAAVALAILALLLLLWRARAANASRGEKVMAIFALGILPVLWIAAVWSHSQNRMKQVGFCLQCHEMKPFGESLHADDEEIIAAVHFQNRYVPKEQACYACHTDYSAFGGVRGKINGLRHVWAHYAGGIPDTIKLYRPYRNGDCLRCHGDSRKFGAQEEHTLPVGRIDSLRSGRRSCLECHDVVHFFPGEPASEVDAGDGAGDTASSSQSDEE